MGWRESVRDGLRREGEREMWAEERRRA